MSVISVEGALLAAGGLAHDAEFLKMREWPLMTRISQMKFSARGAEGAKVRRGGALARASRLTWMVALLASLPWPAHFANSLRRAILLTYGDHP